MRAARALAYCALCAVVQGTVVEISAEGVKKAELEFPDVILGALPSLGLSWAG